MPSVTALRRWLVFAALLRLISVYLGLFDHTKLQGNLYNKKPEIVTAEFGRVLALWTFITCMLCLICAKYPREPAIYAATFISFIVAFLHYATELLYFKTLSAMAALAPLLIAGISCLWMGAGWNYYTQYSRQGAGAPEPLDKQE